MTSELTAIERQYDDEITRWLDELTSFVERDGTQWMSSRDAKRLLHQLQEQQRRFREALDAGERPRLPRETNEVQGRFRRGIEVFETLKHIDRLATHLAEARDARTLDDAEGYTESMSDAATSHRIIEELMANIATMYKSAGEGAEGRRERQRNLESGFDLDRFIVEVQRMRAKNPKVGKRTTVDRVRKLLGITNPKATAILERLAQIERTGRRVW